MNVTTDKKGRINRETYLKIKKLINKERQSKIDALRQFKKNSALAKHLPQSTYSQAINGLKKSIKESDQHLLDWKETYVDSNQSTAAKTIEDMLQNAIKTLEAAESYVRHFAVTKGDAHASGLLSAIKSVSEDVGKFLKGEV